MKTEQLFDVIGDTEERLLKRTERKSVSPWITVSAIAACLCIAVGVITAVGYLNGPSLLAGQKDQAMGTLKEFGADAEDIAVEEDVITDNSVASDGNNAPEACSCVTVGGVQFRPITTPQMRAYGLAQEDTGEVFRVSDADIGACMGIISQCEEESMLGRKAYVFLKFPEDERICLIETNHGMEVFTAVDMPEKPDA